MQIIDQWIVNLDASQIAWEQVVCEVGKWELVNGFILIPPLF